MSVLNTQLTDFKIKISLHHKYFRLKEIKTYTILDLANYFTKEDKFKIGQPKSKLSINYQI